MTTGRGIHTRELEANIIGVMARHSGRGGPRGFRPKREPVTQFLVLPGAVYALAGLATLAFGGTEINFERLKILV